MEIENRFLFHDQETDDDAFDMILWKLNTKAVPYRPVAGREFCSDFYRILLKKKHSLQTLHIHIPATYSSFSKSGFLNEHPFPLTKKKGKSFPQHRRFSSADRDRTRRND